MSKELGCMQIADLRSGDNFDLIKENGKLETFIKKDEGLAELAMCEDVEGKRCYIPSDTYVLL